jgi:hypothetical protein
MSDAKWEVTEGPERVNPQGQDSALFSYTVRKGKEVRTVVVAISETLMASNRDVLATPLDLIVTTEGRAAVEDTIRYDRDPPKRITVSTAGVFEDFG